MKALLQTMWARWAPRALLVLVALNGCAPPRPADLLFGQDPRSMTDAQILQLGMDRLHRHVQPDGPVGVVTETMAEMQDRLGIAVWAYTERRGPGYLIHLGDALHGAFLLDVLEHEWAHALSFDDPSDHGVQWGVEWARAYRAVMRDEDTPDAVAVPVQSPTSSTLP